MLACAQVASIVENACPFAHGSESFVLLSQAQNIKPIITITVVIPKNFVSFKTESPSNLFLYKKHNRKINYCVVVGISAKNCRRQFFAWSLA